MYQALFLLPLCAWEQGYKHTILCCVLLQDVGADQIHIQKTIEAWSTATVSLAHAIQRKGRRKMFYLCTWESLHEHWGVSNCWNGIWNGTVEWKMEWNGEYS